MNGYNRQCKLMNQVFNIKLKVDSYITSQQTICFSNFIVALGGFMNQGLKL